MSKGEYAQLEWNTVLPHVHVSFSIRYFSYISVESVTPSLISKLSKFLIVQIVLNLMRFYFKV
jgi:hypothetical protein